MSKTFEVGTLLEVAEVVKGGPQHPEETPVPEIPVGTLVKVFLDVGTTTHMVHVSLQQDFVDNNGIPGSKGRILPLPIDSLTPAMETC